VGTSYFILFGIFGCLSLVSLATLVFFFEQSRFQPDWPKIFISEEEYAKELEEESRLPSKSKLPTSMEGDEQPLRKISEESINFQESLLTQTHVTCLTDDVTIDIEVPPTAK